MRKDPDDLSRRFRRQLVDALSGSEGEARLRALAEMLIRDALDGDRVARREVIERLDGTPLPGTEVQEPVEVTITVQWLANTPTVSREEEAPAPAQPASLQDVPLADASAPSPVLRAPALAQQPPRPDVAGPEPVRAPRSDLAAGGDPAFRRKPVDLEQSH